MKHMLRSPAHYRAYLEGEDCDSASRRFGRAVHALVLEPHIFHDKFAVWSGARRGSQFDTFAMQHCGKTILTQEEFDRAQECALSLKVNAQFPLGTWLEGVPALGIPEAHTEFTIVWIDEPTGIQCKARIDAHSPDPTPLAVDLKTTDDCRTGSFERQFFRLNYDLQAAHYCEALRAFYGRAFPFALAVVEADAPHLSNMIMVSSDALTNGMAKRRYALERIRQCTETGVWPGYGYQQIEEIGLTPWNEFKERSML
jgi:exodeoxyribonuclease VIII